MVLVQVFVVKLLGSVFDFFAVFCCSLTSCSLARFALFCNNITTMRNITSARLI